MIETTKPTIGRTKKLSEGKDEDEKVGDVSLNSQDKEEFEDVELSVPEEEIESAKKKKEEAGMLDVLRLNKPEWHLIIGSCLFSAPVGAALAFYGLLFAAVVDMFALPTNKIEDRASTLSLIFLGYAGGLALSNIMQYGFLAFSGGRLTKRLRYRSFYTILRQDMSFFDREENNVRQLTTKLAQEASLVLGAGGIRLTMVAEFVASMTTAMIIAFIYGWQLTLFLFAFIPVIMGASVIQTSAAAGFQKDDDEKGNSGGKIISESVMNIRTVQSLHLEPLFYQKYRDSLAAYLKKMLVMSHVIGLAQSISQSMFFFVMAATFRFAAWLVTEGELGPSDSLRVTFAIMFGSYAIGQAMSVMPDYDKAKHAAHSIITLLKEQPLIDNLSERGIELKEEIHEISFEDVYFCYPARKDAKILRGLNLLVEKGTTVALVGPSGCGKSTVMQLLQRFYDPDSGTISINGVDISNMTLQSLRYKLAIVSQEPTLFNASISDNIRYGSLLSNGEFDPDVTHDDVVLAAQQANIAQFIESLPEGYNTNVGEKGTQLSGGQKQRVAIARAILRKPEILLLDEATSALDSESEKVVQKALDKVRQGRTCLVIAHRLNTIQNADKIAVIENGTVVESGTHSELIAQNGLYKQYCNAQSLNHN